jgi:aminoglycoside phosphotransferase (APT) family kinase protein
MTAINIDSYLVHRLIKAQFPQWAALPIRPVELSGWDNRTFHLGDSMTIRLPSQAHYAAQVEKEQFWLPKLAPFLPLPIPKPLAMGKPQAEYPWPWSVYQWIEGDTACIDKISNLSDFALKLAEFLKAIQTIDASEGPEAGPQNFYRGGSLKIYDAETRQAIQNLNHKTEVNRLTELWEKALSSEWEFPPVWIHGDIALGNLLVKNGELSAVIDFGQLGIGDPACDLVIAWTLFHGESRDIFRRALSLDEKPWERAMGWALWKALIIYTALPGTNHSPIEIEKSRRVIDEILNDF